MVGIISSAMLVTITMFSPWGIDTLTLPFPELDGFWGYFYITIFTIGFLAFLPLSEEGFYRVFQASQWKGITADFMISFFFGLMNYFALVFIIDNWGARLIFSLISVGISVVLIFLRDNQNLILSLMARIGINFGIYLWGLFIWKSKELKLPRNHPKDFFSFNPNNIFIFN